MDWRQTTLIVILALCSVLSTVRIIVGKTTDARASSAIATALNLFLLYCAATLEAN